ncbi:hypothetical protein [Vreelandella lionensis]|uniref:hypothetical protein n=1 Tax=Vreelandella lionensis TaxID=1144478 RepID=UPI0030F44CD8
MIREQLEQQQSWIYLAFIVLGLCLGLLAPEQVAALEQALWPLLGLLLYATFTQIPLLQIKQSLQDTRFMAALLMGNFIVLPALLGLLVVWLPLPPPVLAGILLVLLMPCTDWFITFTHLGKGDAALGHCRHATSAVGADDRITGLPVAVFRQRVASLNAIARAIERLFGDYRPASATRLAHRTCGTQVCGGGTYHPRT